MFTLGDFLASVGTLGAALGWIEYRFREVTRDMNTLRTEVDKDREDALNKERDERLRQITNLTAEHQQATARIERRIAETHEKIAEMKLGNLRDLQNYPSKADLQTMVVDRLDKMEERIERALPIRQRSITNH